jgi:hypothetical protein
MLSAAIEQMLWAATQGNCSITPPAEQPHTAAGDVMVMPLAVS